MVQLVPTAVEAAEAMRMLVLESGGAIRTACASREGHESEISNQKTPLVVSIGSSKKLF